MTELIDLKSMNKAEVLAKLYNASSPTGMGFLTATAPNMTVEEAQALLDSGQTYFDHIKGRVMKIDLSRDILDPWLYDRDNGKGCAARALGFGMRVR